MPVEIQHRLFLNSWGGNPDHYLFTKDDYLLCLIVLKVKAYEHKAFLSHFGKKRKGARAHCLP